MNAFLIDTGKELALVDSGTHYLLMLRNPQSHKRWVYDAQPVDA